MSSTNRLPAPTSAVGISSSTTASTSKSKPLQPSTRTTTSTANGGISPPSSLFATSTLLKTPSGQSSSSMPAPSGSTTGMSLDKMPKEKTKERLVGDVQERVLSRKRDVKPGAYDLKKIDGSVTREVKEGGVVVERRFSVLWDQSHKITKDQLTKEHKVVAVDVEERERVQNKVVTREEVIEKKTIVPEKRRIEIPIVHKK